MTLEGFRAARRQAHDAFTAEAEALCAAAEAMAERFDAGATLFVIAVGADATDAAHVAVEFTHPVTVGKRALPAVSLADPSPASGSSATPAVFEHRLRSMASGGDIVLALTTAGPEPAVESVVALAASMGMLTVALTGASDAFGDDPSVSHVLPAPSDDPLVVKELHVTTYHLLWELVHVFLDARPAGSR